VTAARRKGEPPEAASPPAGSFEDAAAESTNEPAEPHAEGAPAEATETAEPLPQQQATDDDDDLGEDGAPVEDGVTSAADLEEASDLEEELADATLDVAQLEQALAERTTDLQRLQAEYLNYKRRVDRDRELVRENATYAALAPIVDVLDTIDRAREHGDLDEGFQAVAEQLERVVSKAGLVKFGEPGEPFDPRLHEALSHIGEDPEVKVTTCKVIAKAGYRIGERVVRAAQVLVVDPAGG
jgi:molecular chaperone GrpE